MKKLLYFAAVIALASLAAGPASAATVYDNTNGFTNAFNVDAWNIGESQYAVADSFTLASSTTVQGVNFWVWAFQGDSLTSVDWSIVANDGSGSYPFDGTVIGSGTASSLVSSFVLTNTHSFDIYQESFATGGLALTSGSTYWLILQNAVAAVGGDPIYWDQSDGPSAAYNNSLGPLANTGSGCGGIGGLGGPTCSETFQLLDTAPGVPEPGTWTLLGGGLTLMAGLIRRKRSR